jgi:hypothetical protein
MEDENLIRTTVWLYDDITQLVKHYLKQDKVSFSEWVRRCQITFLKEKGEQIDDTD